MFEAKVATAAKVPKAKLVASDSQARARELQRAKLEVELKIVQLELKIVQLERSGPSLRELISMYLNLPTATWSAILT